MIEEKDLEVLRVYVNGGDLHRHRPVYELIVEEAQRQGLAGATVLKGIMGYGPDGRIHAARPLRLVEDLPVVVELVDAAEKLDVFMGFVNGVLGEGYATRKKVASRRYRKGERSPGE